MNDFISEKRIFVSYSWDSDAHKKRVADFVYKLRSKGLNVIFDNDMMPGDRMMHFMEKAVTESDIVLFICTPEYKQRADVRKGGVGYESAIITGEIYETQNERKFIPVLFSGSWIESMPNWAKGKLGIDLRTDDTKQYKYLLHTINSFNDEKTITSTPYKVTTIHKSIKNFIIIIIAIVSVCFIVYAFYLISRVVANVFTKIEYMEHQFEDELENLKESLYNINQNSHTNIEITPTNDFNFQLLSPLPQFTNEIIDNYTNVDSLLSNTILLNPTTPIVYNIDTGEEYTSKELYNQQLLFTFNRDSQEIFFLGQFNEEGQLDGNCIVNIYNNNKLILITDTVCNNGELLEYNQVFPCTNSAGQTVWAITNQIPYDSFKNGETLYYFREDDLVQAFNSNNVTPENIITVDEFSSRINTTLEGYYCGNTSNGYFNDTTGDAQMVKFSKDGTVSAVYVGNFKDGQFDDHTGNAWLIAKGETNYIYYKGMFTNGIRLDDKAVKILISQKEIEEIVNETHFNCELKWE